MFSRVLNTKRYFVIGILIAGGFSTTYAQATLQYQIVGDEFVFSNGDAWVISHGQISWQLFDVLSSEEGPQRAVYGVTAFSLAAVDLLGASHTITAIPDGLRSPAFHDPFVPDIVQDIGLVNVYPDGSLDLIVYDLSIEGAPVEPLDTIGGPSFVGSAWLGSFPMPKSFAASFLVSLRSQDLHGDASLVGSFVPEASSVVLASFAVIGVAICGARQCRTCRALTTRYQGRTRLD
jgi:hypothetical protein